MSPAQQVLVKGVKVSSRNVHEIINLIESQFHYLEGRIAQVSALAHDEIEIQRVNYCNLNIKRILCKGMRFFRLKVKV